jgi:large repetitive protein
VAAPTVPGGLPVFIPAVGAVSTDVSNNAAQGATPAQMESAIDPNANNRPNDAGEDNPTPVSLAYAAALRGSVWFDSTSNRTRDAGEAGVANFGVELINAATNQVVACVSGVNSTIGCVTMPDGRSLFATNANGNYEVIGIPAATYLVQFRDGANNIIYGTPVNGSSNPQSTVTVARDALRVNLTPGAAVVDQSLPLDPSGVVYNSLLTSRAPIPGAIVTFCGPAGFNALTQLVGGASYTAVPGQPNCAAMTVGALGFYQFLLQPGSPNGQYTLAAAAPGFFGPSVAIPPTGMPPVLPPAPGVFPVQPQATPPTGAQATTYYLVLNLSGGVQDVVHNHIPLDPLGNARLFVTKTVNQRTAEIGDSVEYTISITSPDTAVTGVSVTDRLPTGFRLISRTVRVNGVSVADPAGMPGPQLNFNVGTVAQNVPTRITYRVRLGVGSQIGDGINRASASAPGGINSNIAQAVVKVTGGVFTSEGCIVGKIFVDCNRNHTQEAGEPGIPGVRLYLEDGTYLISDRDGKYSYCGLSNSTHVLKVDPRTLPKDSRMTTFSNRNVGDAESVLIDMRSGELHRADFVEGSCKPEILEEVEKRRGRALPLGTIDQPAAPGSAKDNSGSLPADQGVQK